MAVRPRYRTAPALKQRLTRRARALAVATLLSACASGPPAPDWQLDAKLFSERATQAYLEGDAILEAKDFAQARSALARTGRVDLLARIELLRCATRVASLVFEPCEEFEKLAGDAAAPERAYADYLAGRLHASQIDLLPPQQRAFVRAPMDDRQIAAELESEPQALSALVGAGVAFESGRAGPEVIDRAIERASAQGWRRPLLAWLGVALARARHGGDPGLQDRLQRRIDQVQGSR